MSKAKPVAGGGPSSAAEARAKEMIGRVLLHRYRIEELVAMGGLGAVYRATRLATGEDVAIKVLHPDVEGLPELVMRFEREAVAGKHILDPNVAAVFEFDQFDDGSYFLAQEFIRGKTLREVMNKGPIPAARAAKVRAELTSALSAAHEMGIVHRDVKPRNVMILDGKDERVQLIDFGLAKVPVEHLAIADEDSRRSLTQAGVVMGTIAYMAPEAALGMRSVDKRADLYAVGLILYEMLAGKHPFTATEPTALFAQQRSAVPPPIATRTPGVVVPQALEDVMQKLLAKDPNARYASARAAVAALEAAMSASSPRSTRAPGSMHPSSIAAPRKGAGMGARISLPRWAPLAAAGLLLVVIVIFAARCGF